MGNLGRGGHSGDDNGAGIFADFDIVRILETSALLTRTGSMQGTPEYVSPEPALGKTADPRSNIYPLATAMDPSSQRSTPPSHRPPR